MINKVIIIGNLGRDPEMRSTKGGTSVCNLSVATTRKYKKNEEWTEETEWHRIVVWGKTAENCERYLEKGRQVYVEGRLQTSKYEKDGVTHYSTDIVADTVQFLGGKSESKRDAPASSGGTDFDDDDDLPF